MKKNSLTDSLARMLCRVMVCAVIGVVLSLAEPLVRYGYCTDSVPAPLWMELTPVGDKMVVSGMPSMVHFFSAGRSTDEVLRFYRQIWSAPYDGRSGYREVDVAPWHIISRLERRYLFTVQVKATGGMSSEGYLAVADLQEIEKTARVHEVIPQLAGSRVLSDTISYDPGKKGQTLMLANNFSVDSNINFYRNHYLSRGWGQLMDQDLPNSSVLAFRRFGKEVHLVINQSDSGSIVVMNRTETN